MRKYNCVTLQRCNPNAGLSRAASRGPDEYRDLMTRLGEELARQLSPFVSRFARTLLICTNEDADFLAKGVLQELDRLNYRSVFLACFWNDRQRIGADIDVAPIFRRYVEPTDGVDFFIAVKSIISERLRRKDKHH